jgi:hypothetical protein
MSAKKGEKYRGQLTGNVYEIVADPFEWQGRSYIAWHSNESDGPEIAGADHFEQDHYTLIREPKFKVGDRIKWGWDGKATIVAITPDPDPDGDFGHLVKNDAGWFSLIHRPEAAE